jgi:hypothetical protein
MTDDFVVDGTPIEDLSRGRLEARRSELRGKIVRELARLDLKRFRSLASERIESKAIEESAFGSTREGER